MKLLRILKALAKPRLSAGIIPFVIVVWLASLQVWRGIGQFPQVFGLARQWVLLMNLSSKK